MVLPISSLWSSTSPQACRPPNSSKAQHHNSIHMMVFCHTDMQCPFLYLQIMSQRMNYNTNLCTILFSGFISKCIIAGVLICMYIYNSYAVCSATNNLSWVVQQCLDIYRCQGVAYMYISDIIRELCFFNKQLMQLTTMHIISEQVQMFFTYSISHKHNDVGMAK